MHCSFLFIILAAALEGERIHVILQQHMFVHVRDDCSVPHQALNYPQSKYRMPTWNVCRAATCTSGCADVAPMIHMHSRQHAHSYFVRHVC